LLAAADNGRTDVVEKLLQRGENVNAKDPTYGATPLIYAAQSGNMDIVKLLLDKGADINAKTRMDQTALIQAALADRADVVGLLLNRGAKLEEKDRDRLLTSINDPVIINMLPPPAQDKPHP
jgi:ankyrin repeat protein